MHPAELNILIQELLFQAKESEWLEFKLNNSNPYQIGEYISALANSASYHNKNNAYLLFGITDNGSVAGTDFKPSIEKVKEQELQNWIATQLEPRIDFSVYEFKYFDKDLVLFKIDSAINTPVEFRGEAFIRIGSYKKKLKEHPERERKIWTKISNYTFEKGIAERGFDEDEILKLIDYSAYFELTEQSLPANKETILEKLIQEKIITDLGHNYSITNLGAILFAKSIDYFDSISRKAIRVIFYKGNDKTKTIKEQVGKKGYANGFNGLISFINDHLPSNEEIGKAFRQELKMFPPLAVRELVVNAIIHQDFSIQGASPMIEVYDNRIEISNPGKPIIPTLRFIDHNPESRNEMLAKFMRRMNICEERGSAIDKVVAQCELFQLPAPDFIEGDNYTKVILYATKSLRQMDKNDKIRACYQHCVLKYISGNFMTNQSLRERFDIDDSNYPVISRIIAEAKEAKMIKDYDSDNKAPRYSKYIPFWA
ncbi:MAG: putative DNA binding domain-containing protein [Chitinophagaceae bacterium]|nr:putative DNA binding domain-containing protein [Chitinophagaceae bacterium]